MNYRHQACCNLIEKLIQCPQGQEPYILKQNSHLIDIEFVKLMRQKALELEERNNRTGILLRLIADDIALQIESRPSPVHLDLLIQILETIRIYEDKAEQKVYPILKANVTLIDRRFRQAIRIKVTSMVSEMNSSHRKVLGHCLTEFASMIYSFPFGNKVENLETAIAGHEIALKIIPKEHNSLMWARTQINLGLVYQDRIIDTRTKNLEKAISCFQSSLQILTEPRNSYDWAKANTALGIVYIERTNGNKHDNQEKAISYFNDALRVFSENSYPQDWALIQINLSNVFQERIYEDTTKNLQLAFRHALAALKVFGRYNFPKRWADAKINLSNCYSLSKGKNKPETINNAISCYEEALEIYTENDFPEDWAEIKIRLGICYKKLSIGSQLENSELSIKHHEAALKVYTKDRNPWKWASTQYLLGNSYINRVKGDKASNIETAISSFKKSLEVIDRSNDSLQLGRIQNSLGIAYRHRMISDRSNNIETSISYFQAALDTITEYKDPKEWAEVQINMGNVYVYRIDGDKESNINCSISHYQNALKIISESSNPYKWAKIQLNLGNAYLEKASREKERNLKATIYYSKEALTLFKENEYPNEWALAHNNLAAAYDKLSSVQKPEYAQKAIDSYLENLRINTPDTNPFECFRTARNLGHLAFREKNYSLAIDAYSTAIKATEKLRLWALDDKRKEGIFFDAIEVYENIIKSCIEVNQLDKAFEFLERSKTRNLANLISNRNNLPKGDFSQNLLDNYKRLRDQLITATKSYKEFTLQEESTINFQTQNIRLSKLQQNLETFIDEYINPIDPSFQLVQQTKPIKYGEAKALLNTKNTALLEWYIDVGGMSIFIVTQQNDNPLYIKYNNEDYSKLLHLTNIYLKKYWNQQQIWLDNLPNLLKEIGEALQIETLQKKYFGYCDRLILVPHRWLHLLPIHVLPLADGGKCVLDLFSQGVSYSPSTQLLQLTQKQNKPQLTNLFAVENPTEDPELEFTSVEVAAIRSQFQPNADVLKGQEAYKQALTKERLGQANCTHFSCHGRFHFENPELSALLLANSMLEEAKEQLETEHKEDETRFLANRDGRNIDLEHCLTLGEIFGLDLRNCRLVTLSACETGLTDFKSLSDEYIGLPSGFLYAGSPSVVSSLWAVDDLSTTFLMIKFYQNLQQIVSVPIALNQAQLWLRDVTKEELIEWKKTLDIGSQMWKIDLLLMNMPDDFRPYSSPYHWAAFCAIGS